MNNLSWFLYLIEMLSTIDDILINVLWLFPLVAILSILLGFILFSDQPKVLKDSFIVFLKKWIPRFSIFILIVFIITTIIPSKITMYAITASQVGETIIQLEQTQEIGGELGELAKDSLSLLRQKINEQLNEQEK